MSSLKHKKVLNIPNVLTIFRIGLIPLIIFGLYSKDPSMLVLSAILFIVAALTDALDGYIARRFGQVTNLGILLDPIADKLLILSVLFTFADINLIPIWIPLLVLAREMIVTNAVGYETKRGNIPKSEWSGKLKTVLQVISISIAYIHLIVINSYLRLGKPSPITNSTEIVYYFFVFTVIVTFILLGFGIKEHLRVIEEEINK